MSPRRIHGVIPDSVRSLIQDNGAIRMAAARLISSAANANKNRGKTSIFGKDRYAPAYSEFEHTAANFLDQLEDAGAFEEFGRVNSIYYVMDTILHGAWTHPEMDESKKYWEFLREKHYGKSSYLWRVP
jgi:hypothetical protein